MTRTARRGEKQTKEEKITSKRRRRGLVERTGTLMKTAYLPPKERKNEKETAVLEVEG